MKEVHDGFGNAPELRNFLVYHYFLVVHVDCGQILDEGGFIFEVVFGNQFHRLVFIVHESDNLSVSIIVLS